MIAQKIGCLDQDSIRDLLEGRMPSDRFEDALAHLDDCDRCRSKAEASGDLSFLRSWFGPTSDVPPEEAYSQESQCVAAVQDLLLNDPKDVEVNPGTPPSAPKQLGSYLLTQLIGIGGMGMVFRAEHQRLKKRVAIKILPTEKANRPAWLDRFNREMTSIAALEHPHIVRALDAGEDQGHHYLVMEHLEGFDLGRITRRVCEISVPSACEIVRQAAMGLEAIHEANMVHRDVKPSNLFLTQSGTVKLLDLGLVLDGESPVAGDDRLTTVGHLMGTLPYMSREQINDSSQVDFQADLYSLGATLFRLLAGTPPLGSSSDLPGTVSLITSQDCPSLGEVRSDLPKHLVQLVDQLLSHDPNARPKSASQLAEQLAPFCEGHDLRGLLRIAESLPEDTATSPAMTAGFPVTANNGSSARSGWMVWLAMMFLPVAALSGVLITLATDRGTLVIESEASDVEIAIKQNSKVVKQLLLAEDKNKVKLWSGNYEIELLGENLDRLGLENGVVSIFRGTNEVVKILERSSDKDEYDSSGQIEIPLGSSPADSDAWELARRRSSGAPSAPSAPSSGLPESFGSGKVFQGKSFRHWLNILSREQDSLTLFEAMQAVQLLAESKEEQLVAATEMLRPARRLGGISWGRPDGGKRAAVTPEEQSQAYMANLKDAFKNLPVVVRLQATLAELENEDFESTTASMLLLDDMRLYELRREVQSDESAKLVRELVIQLTSDIERLKSRFDSIVPLTTKRNELHGSLVANEIQATIQTAYKVKLMLPTRTWKNHRHSVRRAVS